MTLKQQRSARRKQAQKQITQQAVRKIATMAVSTPRKKKRTPFADVGSIIGGGVGSMFGFPHAKGIGKWLGSGIGSIFGSGDYQVVGQSPSYNVLANGNQIPKFSTTRATNLVSHREYLGDITGTAAFTNRSYPLNPGSDLTFPWLSTIAQNYQQYKWHGIIFEFRPLITDFVTSGAPGVVVMATNYNADEPAYLTKQAMENSEYAVSVKPTQNLMHGVECASNQTVLSELYVRPGGLASNLDLKFTDLGNFQFASQGNPVQLLGELWVSYTVEFFKPVLPTDVGGDIQTSSSTRASFSPGAPLGTIGVSLSGDLVGFSITSTTITWTAQPGNFYLMAISWRGTIAGAYVAPVTTVTGANQPNVFFNDIASFTSSPGAGVVTDQATLNAVFRSTSTTPGPISVVFGLAGTYPTGTTTMDVMVTQISNNI